MGRLGNYEIDGALGRGGMADVWRGRHLDGTLVALKVLHDDRGHELLRRELQIMARLDHPAIIRVLEWGEATASEAQSVGVEPGTLWIALNLAEHGSFQPATVRDFSGFRRLALQILDALMHAHARGVIHRDIKPDNILVHNAGERVRYLLTDFGIAFPREGLHHGTDEVRLAAAGTLFYMAPEQLLGRWREFAAHTDLFSLGVVFYEIVAGRMPFVGQTRVDLALAHPRGADEIAQPRFALPPGFENWLMSMLSYEPAGRFAFAADAAQALLELPAVAGVEGPRSGAQLATELTTLPLDWVTDLDAPAARHLVEPTVHIGNSRARIRDDWRDDRGDEPTVAMGLRQFGLRRAGIFGRERERDALWAALLETIGSGKARTVVLRGRTGMGSERLGRWLGERANELGMAAHIRARRRRGLSALGDTIAHELGVAGLDPRARRDRLDHLLAGTDVDVELLEHVLTDVTLSVPDRTYAVCCVLRHFSRARPLIVHCADAHLELDMIETALEATGNEMPVLIVLSVSDEDVQSTPFEGSRLAVLAELPRVDVVELGPMQEPEMVRFIGAVEDVEPSLLTQIVETSRGNPLRALQLIELAVANGEVVDEPLGSLWRRRIDANLAPEHVAPLVAAAVLGNERIEVWRKLCRSVGVEVPGDTLTRLIEARMLDFDDFAFEFEHQSLRSAVLSDDRFAGLRTQLHSAAAQLWSSKTRVGRARKAWDLLAAGEVDEGVSLLFDVVNLLLFEGRTAHARSTLERIQQEIPKQDTPTIAAEFAALMMALVVNARGDHDEARQISQGVAEVAVTHGWNALAAEARRLESLAYSYLSDAEAALTAAKEAVRYGELTGDTELMSRLLHRLGRCHLRAARLQEAVTTLELATETPYLASRIQALTSLAHALTELGRMEEARQTLSECVEQASAAGARVQTGHALNSLADIEVQLGRFDVADAHLERALNLLKRSSPETVAQLLLNRAAVAVAAEQPQHATELLEVAMQKTAADSFTAGFGRLLRAVIAAQLGDEERWHALIAHLEDDRYTGVANAKLCLLAADGWQAHGRSDLAERALGAATRKLVGVEGHAADELRRRAVL